MTNPDKITTSRYYQSLKTIRGFFAILLISCFAGYAAGSCLSYGHSCWGAHGKRSYNGPRVSQYRQIDSRQNAQPVAGLERDDIPATTNSKNRWFLSRLITGRQAIPAAASVVGKDLGDRWYESILAVPGNWDNDDGTVRNQDFRNEKGDVEEGGADSAEVDNHLDLSRKMTKPRDETTELLFVPSQKENVNHHSSHTRKLRLYKILTDSLEDAL